MESIYCTGCRMRSEGGNKEDSIKKKREKRMDHGGIEVAKEKESGIEGK